MWHINKILTVKTNGIIGMLYLPAKKTKSVVLHAKGGPSFGDSGKSPLWISAQKYGYALFVPDYIGYCRSDGDFNFKNCIMTLTLSKNFLTGKSTGIEVESSKTIRPTFKEVILVGSSWGGAIVPFIDKYEYSSIQTVGLIKPITDWSTQGKTKYKEENVEETANLIKFAWSNIYRGFDKSEWPDVFKGNLSEYNPINNLELLQNKTIFICHGKKDVSINWKRSLNFYKNLKLKYPETKVYLKLFENEGHTDEINTKGLDYILKTFQH